jgi:hypothetical protein
MPLWVWKLLCCELGFLSYKNLYITRLFIAFPIIAHNLWLFNANINIPSYYLIVLATRDLPLLRICNQTQVPVPLQRYLFCV